jgi:hypothetical protein
MLSTRSAHYWLWFLLFGIVATLVSLHQGGGLSAESVWLLVTGALGVLTGAIKSLMRPYDLAAGLVFTGVGMLGILHNLGFILVATNSSVPNGTVNNAAILGLSLGLTYSLIHTLLGLTSLNHGIAARVAAPMPATERAAA